MVTETALESLMWIALSCIGSVLGTLLCVAVGRLSEKLNELF